MDDIAKDKQHFCIKDTNPDAYTEQEVLELISEIKESQKVLRGPDRMKTVYKKSFQTLQELMSQMNQSILFNIIAEKYNETNLDNTVKLLVRCKQMLTTRKIAFNTL